MSAGEFSMPRTPLDALADLLDIPNTAYESASSRYRDLGTWLQEPIRSTSSRYHPDVSPQGSFRLGTVTRPWKRDDYDLDLTCVLHGDIDHSSWTQEQVKEMVGADLDAYRRERRISEQLKEKHRCWRLIYQDDLAFHMDVVPAIPQAQPVRSHLQNLMVTAGAPEPLAQDVARLTVVITDDRHPHYHSVCDDWFTSNPEGYARWFEARMRQAETYLQWKALREQVKSVDKLPTHLWKTPLQRVVQILKRHRDVMFERNSDTQPASIIITTLAARAYAGEANLHQAMANILSKIEEHVATVPPRVPNPVNPEEDFADRWSTREGRRLELERKFRLWLHQARTDFDLFTYAPTVDAMVEQAEAKFGVKIDKQIFGNAGGSAATHQQASAVHHIRGSSSPKPWRR
ncbi:MAG: nucleotidyltransferase [Trueperaceae bacterium]|nr:nucleotidyltransferase [Trueperaceae bacterium]